MHSHLLFHHLAGTFMDLGMPIESVNERKLCGMPDRLAKMGGISWSLFFNCADFPGILQNSRSM
jgi:hypothetical protein